jgi:two-component system, NtrC family, sensor kinase
MIQFLKHIVLLNPFRKTGVKAYFLLILLAQLLFPGLQGYGNTMERLDAITVRNDRPYPVKGSALMLRTDKGADAAEIILNLSAFRPFKNSEIKIDPEGRYDFWFLFKVKSDLSPLYLTLPLIQNFELDLYRIDSNNAVLISKGGILTPGDQKFLNHETELFDLKIIPGEENTYLLKINRTLFKTFSATIFTARALIKQNHHSFILEGILLGIILCVVLYHLLIYFRIREKEYLLLALYMFFLLLQVSTHTGLSNAVLVFDNPRWYHILFNFIPSFSAIFSFWFSYAFLNINRTTHPLITRIIWIFQGIFIISAIFSLFSVTEFERLTVLASGFAAVFLFIIGVVRYRQKFRPAVVYLIAYVPTFFSIPYLLLYVSGNLPYSWFTHNNLLISIAMQAILFSLAIAAKIRMLKNENEVLLREENIRLEDMVQARTAELQKEKGRVENTLIELKTTQSQLIHAEKMASLGELTAGIAHEIQNPLNFVNNFSEVSIELVDEMKHELAVGSMQLAGEIADDLKQNLEKINHHGKRADAIVKGMLQHSRTSTGQKEPTDINALCDEYLRLAYHGLRAKDKSFNAIMKTDFDETIGSVNIIPQDIGRVILNLITNAFYAVDEKKRQLVSDLSAFSNLTGLNTYEPTVSVSTKNIENKVLISVRDNGNGIPKQITDKIFQPFFTTKPTGQGTGLGLSISYDIIKAHGGEINLTSNDEGTIFNILLKI